jgi:P27 family predicted phage terminase small subunit
MALKKLEGTVRADRTTPNAPEPEPGIPDLPQGFGEATPWGHHSVAEYWRMAGALKDIGLLSEIDRPSFLLYCDSFGRWMHYREMIGKHGDTQLIGEDQRAYASVYVGLMNKASDEMRKTLALFGLSPADRTRVSAAKKKQPDNPFAKYA